MSSEPVQESQGATSATENPSSTSGKGSSGGVSSNTHISSLSDLKHKAPKVYQAMMVGIAMNITQDMEKSQARLKRMMDDARRDAQQ